MLKPKKGKENYTAARNIDFDSNSNASTVISDTTDENFQVQGPTTRRQWSELVSKPKSDSASMVASSNEEDENEGTTGSLCQVCCLPCADTFVLFVLFTVVLFWISSLSIHWGLEIYVYTYLFSRLEPKELFF